MLGPILWNVLYDEVLRLNLTEGVTAIGFADDLALVVLGEDEEELMHRADESLRCIDNWMRDHHLELAPQKTEAVILKGKRKRDGVYFRLRNTEIKPTNSVKYLGITIDQKMTFGEHIAGALEKAEKKVASLTRLMPNIGGPRSAKRQVLCSVISSTVLYGAPIWYKALEKKKYRTQLEMQQRRHLLRQASAFRTVSAKAVQVITGTVPIQLMARERHLVHNRGDLKLAEAKRAARATVINEWQEEWETEQTVASWTRKLIPDIEPWLSCRHRDLDYYMTQVLSGHGMFASYAKRMGKGSDGCMYCGEDDTVQHTFFECARWEEQREQANMELGIRLAPCNFSETVVAEHKAWHVVRGLARQILSKKEYDTRALQARGE